MEELYLTIVNNLRDGLYYVDTERRIKFWNHAAEEISGYKAEEVIGKDCPSTYLHHIDEEGRPLCVVGCPLFATIVDGQQREARVFLRHKEGYRVPVLIKTIPVNKEGETVGVIEIFTKDTPTVYDDELIEHLEGIAMHDDLTNLPNRRYLENFLQYKFDEYRRFGKTFAVMFGDIDNFSYFNNQYGHEIGDEVLISIGKGVQYNTRKEDMVGRWGGEEFVGIYSVSDEEEAFQLAEQYRRLVGGTEVIHEDLVLTVTMSIGVTMAHPEDTIESIIERADRLMYESKKHGKNKATCEMH